MDRNKYGESGKGSLRESLDEDNEKYRNIIRAHVSEKGNEELLY